MALSIRNPEADRLARELAARQGVSMTEAIIGALRKALEEAPKPRKRKLSDELEEIARRYRELPVLDHRSEDEILGYPEMFPELYGRKPE